MTWSQSMWSVEEGIKLVVNGNSNVVQPGDSFTDTVKKMAKDAGLKTFRVTVDGKEMDDPSDAPVDFNGITIVKIEPYDEAGR